MKIASDKNSVNISRSTYSTVLHHLSNIMAPLLVYKNLNSFILSQAYINNKHKL